MATISHPSMSKGNTTKSVQETFVVDDLSSFGEEVPVKEDIVQFISTVPKKKISEEQKKQIEDLIFLGKVSKSVEIAGHIFELNTLTNKEHNNLMKELSKITESTNIFNIRIYTLSGALKTIDGVKLEEIEFEGEFETVFERKLAILDNMQLKVIERLFNEYSAMLDETDKIVDGDSLKK